MCYVMTKRGGTDRTKKRERHDGNKRSEEVKQCILCTPKKASAAHNSTCARFRLFFSTLCPSFLFFFLENTPKRHARYNNCVVSFTTGYVNTFQKPASAQAKQRIQKEKRFRLPQGREEVNAFHFTSMHSVVRTPRWVATSVAELSFCGVFSPPARYC